MRRITHVGTLLLVAGLVLGVSTTPRAETNKDKARVLFRQATQLFKRGLLLDALRKYREARKLYPSYKIDLNIGGTLDRLGRHTEAAAYFEKFVLESRSKAPPKILAVAQQRLKILKAKLGSVKVSCSHQGAVLEVDGEIVGRTPRDLPLYFEPGEHIIRVHKEGLAPSSTRLTVGAGKHTKLPISLKKKGVSAKRVKPAAETKPRPGLSDELRRVHRRKTVTGTIALGVGGAAAVAAVVLYAVGGAQGSAAYDDYSGRNGPDSGPAIEAAYDDVDAAKTKLYVAHGLVGGAAVAFGVAIYQFVTRPDLERPNPSERRAAVGFAPVNGGGVLSLGGRF